MGILITPGDSTTSWEIPLVGLSDGKWADNTWLVDSLRQLANKIERENPKVYSIGVKINAQYKSPNLILEIFEKDDEKNKLTLPI